jgi:glycosyltransferase involved in cell wall biosynthesis
VTYPSFSIVVPTFRRPGALRDTLAALLALDYERNRYEVIVVDDGADETTAEIVCELQGRHVEIALHTQHHRGAASARNRGARLAKGDLLLFVDDDILVEPDHLLRHRMSRDRHGDALVNGAWEFAPDVLHALRATPFGRFRIGLERQFQNEAIGTPLSDGCVEQALLGSWDLALRRELFWDLGGFDEQFPVAGAEDQDFSLRARAAGYLLLLDTRIRCQHNDDRLNLRSYCRREERSAQTMPLLARKYPDEFGEVAYVRENRPISRGDPPRLVIKKLLKWALANGPTLDALHRVADLLETAHLPERLLRRVYRPLLGLHLFRGFRRTWA